MIALKYRLWEMCATVLLGSMSMRSTALGDWVQWSVADGGNGHWYRLTSNPGTWQDAENEAVADGAHLVTINDAAEQQWLVTTFGFGGSFGAWIGFTDQAVEGTWVWVAGDGGTWQQTEFPCTWPCDGVSTGYVDWHVYVDGEPNNNASDPGEDWAILGEGIDGMHWGDYSHTSVNFVPQYGVIERATSGGSDCNDNGVPDEWEITRPSTVLETLSVPATGGLVMTQTVLVADQPYWLLASGTYRHAFAGQNADAEWGQIDPGGPWVEVPDPDLPEYEHDVVVDDPSEDWWGSAMPGADAIANFTSFLPHTFSPSHQYWLPVVGQGQALELWIPDFAYSDNAGALTIQIWSSIGHDCDANGVPDDCQPDCDGDRTPDVCELPPLGTGSDCNGNGIPDECDGYLCNDGNPCTDDGCAGTTCRFTINVGPCEDGFYCTVGDICVEGVCRSGPPRDCGDDDPCTAEACDEDAAACMYTETDADGDGICDGDDACPESDTSVTNVIDGCDSGVENLLLDGGCTMTDEIAECAASARNHGAFVSCVAHLTNRWKRDGLISGAEKGRIQSCAARSSIP